MTFFIGEDLGQASDFTALGVIEAVPHEYRVRHLQRFPLGTSYPRMVDRTTEIKRSLSGSILAVDGTGVGRPVIDLFWDAGLAPWSITITGAGVARNEATEAVRKGGMIVTPSLRDQLTWNVPKRDLVGAMAIAFQTRMLKISSKLPDAKILTDELLNFKVKITESRKGKPHDSYEAWREGDHDDLVLAVAIALWVARKVGTQSAPIANAGGFSSIETLGRLGGNPIRRMREGFSGGDLPGLSG